MNKHEELRLKLEGISNGKPDAHKVIMDVLKYLMDLNQPERSKREDHCPECKNSLISDDGSLWCQSCDWRGWVKKDNGCGALNSMET